MEADQSATKRRRKSVQKHRAEDAPGVKRTFVIEPDVDSKIDILARKRQMSRSDFVNEVLKRETRFIVIQYRSGDPGEDATAA